MQKFLNKLEEIKAKEIGFMGHIVGGYPDKESSLKAALGICRGGADFLEVQFPFSDPTADGPTIEGACYNSLMAGFKLNDGFDLVKELSSKTETVIIVMTYANIPFKYGMENFVKMSKEAGAEAFIIPDLPPEMDEELSALCTRYEMANILLVAPGADKERIQSVSQRGSGLLYTVTRRGTTGRKTSMSDEVLDWINLVKENSVLPIAAGLGIRSNEQIKELRGRADVAVVGSHFVNTITRCKEEGLDIEETLYKTMVELIK